MANAKKSLSSYQLARDLELNQKTAWYMQQRIRAAMASDEGALLQGIIEADETYLGGKPRHKDKDNRRGSWSFGQNLRRGSRPAQGRSQGRSYRRYQGRDRLGLYRAVRRACPTAMAFSSSISTPNPGPSGNDANPSASKVHVLCATPSGNW